jgi:Mrp family chromosome partitioning ATPase/uncharacterized protein involved in exopolysaccharide biosynthesis
MAYWLYCHGRRDSGCGLLHRTKEQPTILFRGKLLIKYVVETKAPSQVNANNPKFEQVDEGGSVMDTEYEILTSRDLASRARARLVTRYGANSEQGKVEVGEIIQNLKVQTIHGKVVRLSFGHHNRAVTQPVLEEVIKSYNEMHDDFHKTKMGEALSASLSDQSTKFETQLSATEKSLADIKTKEGVVSWEDTKRTLSERLGKLQQSMLDTRSELEERQAGMVELGKLIPGLETSPTNVSNEVTNQAAIPAEKLAEYRRNSELLDTLNKRERELLVTFTPENALVKSIRQQIETNEARLREMEAVEPRLIASRPVSDSKTGGADAPRSPQLLYAMEKSRVTALNAKYKVLTNEFAEVDKKLNAIGANDRRLTELERKRRLDERNYESFSTGSAQVDLDRALNDRKIPNIVEIQKPSPGLDPNPLEEQKLKKTAALIFLAGVFGAIGLAFVLEFYVDRSFKRPQDLASHLGLPLFISIPRIYLNGHANARLGPPRTAGLIENKAGDSAGPKAPKDDKGNGGRTVALKGQDVELAAWDQDHPLQPFHGALRDRLITYFEVNNMTSKPKLVAVTSCNEGSGVSTVAAGLAASLSETGDGNVLLVDMNQQGAAHYFRRGELACGLDEALEPGRRGETQVQDRLYVVSEASNVEKLPSVLPKRFKNLVPRLKASDYDYIIFDMPPVSQISMTPRLAKFMDMVLMVVEAEKSDRDVVKAATGLLKEARANVGVVLNKQRSYVPKRLQQEF